MPLYEFACEACRKTFDERVPVGVRITMCACGAVARKRFVPTTQIRITEGFRDVSRSDVCPEKGKDWIPSVWPGADVRPSGTRGLKK